LRSSGTNKLKEQVSISDRDFCQYATARELRTGNLNGIVGSQRAGISHQKETPDEKTDSLFHLLARNLIAQSVDHTARVFRKIADAAGWKRFRDHDECLKGPGDSCNFEEGEAEVAEG
jgi:hypothetical protein